MGTLPQALFFSQKNGPHISGSPELVGTLPQALFFFRKMAPIFLEAPPYCWKPCTADYAAAGVFFVLQNNGPHISGCPEFVGTLPQALFFFQKNGPHILGSPKRLTTLPQAPFFSPENWPPYF